MPIRIKRGPPATRVNNRIIRTRLSHQNTMDDTETLVATVASLLPKDCDSLSQGELINAIVESNGNVEDAVRLLSNTSRLSRKRKRVDLDSWLKPPTKKTEIQGSPSPPGRKVEKPSSSSSLQEPANLMSFLRPPPSPQKAAAPQLPPLLLATPELVAKHTPCTLHLSVLPPELACQLFYTMIDLSKDWQRNKWWLFDRLVESPHLTSFFARQTNGIDDDSSWQEAARYWYELNPPQHTWTLFIIKQVQRSNDRSTSSVPFGHGRCLPIHRECG
jgi:hypothetical protein